MADHVVAMTSTPACRDRFHKRWMPARPGQRFDRYLPTTSLTDYRRGGGVIGRGMPTRPTSLQMLATAVDTEGDSALPRQQVKARVSLPVLAGHPDHLHAEHLSWAWMLLSGQPRGPYPSRDHDASASRGNCICGPGCASLDSSLVLVAERSYLPVLSQVDKVANW
jgi:hypothetical protein